MTGKPSVRGFRIAILVVCTVGVCLSADLLRLHVKVHTDPDYHSYCAISESVNCETVAASPYAVFFGLPVALWGLWTYLVQGGLTVWGLRPRQRTASWPFGLLFWLSLVTSAVGVLLFFISHYVIESVCLVCAGSYLVNLILWGLTWLELRRVGLGPWAAVSEEIREFRSRPRALAMYGGLSAAALLLTWLALPVYWQIEAQQGPGGLNVGRTGDGHPWIGAASPTVEIEEYSDYQCPHCRRGHDEMRELVAQNADTVRLIHRNFPLDQACNPIVKKAFHPLACHYARLAYCAGKQGRFWDANDLLFAEGRRRQTVTVEEIAEQFELNAERLGSCMDGAEAVRSVVADIREGLDHNIRGTPTFVLNGRIFPGSIPAEVLDEALGRVASSPAP